MEKTEHELKSGTKKGNEKLLKIKRVKKKEEEKGGKMNENKKENNRRMKTRDKD